MYNCYKDYHNHYVSNAKLKNRGLNCRFTALPLDAHRFGFGKISCLPIDKLALGQIIAPGVYGDPGID